VTDVTRAVERLGRLTHVQRRLERTLRRVSDLVFDEQTRCWTDATMLYGVLRQVGRRNPAVARDLEPVVTFFRRGKKKATVTEPAAPTPKPAFVPVIAAPQPDAALNGAGVSH